MVSNNTRREGMRELLTRETLRIFFNVIVITSLLAIGAYGGYTSVEPIIIEQPCEINIEELRLAETGY